MAELVPNCPHVLHFSDEEVEFLQSVILELKEDSYESYANGVSALLLAKYPPHDINKNINDPHSIDIPVCSRENIFSYLLWFFENASTQYSWQYRHFSYFLLVAMYEKLEFPTYNDFENPYYYKVTFCLYRLIKYYMTWYKEKLNKKVFPIFQKNENTTPSIAEASSIFVPMRTKDTQVSRKNIQKCCLL